MSKHTWAKGFGVGTAESKTPPRSADEFVFGTDPGEQICLSLPPGLHLRAKIGCAAKGVELEDLVVALLEAQFPVAPESQKTSSSL